MAKTFYAVLCFVVLLCCFGCKPPAPSAEQGETGNGYTIADAQGTVVAMSGKPHRIVTLSMSTDEVMLGLVPPSDMAAVDRLLDDPISSNVTALAQKVEGRIANPTVEEIAALHPDLVILPDWGDVSQAAALRDLGLKVVVCKGARNLSEIKETIRLLSEAVGEPKRGEVLIQKMEQRLAWIKERVDKIPTEERKKVVLISLMSSYGGIGSSFDEACRYAGVINGPSVIGLRDGQVMSKEQLVKINPDIIFLPSYTNHGEFDVEAFRRAYIEDPSLSSITAVKEKNFREPFEGYVYNCSQDFVFGVQEIAYRVYGDAFSQPADEHLSALE